VCSFADAKLRVQAFLIIVGAILFIYRLLCLYVRAGVAFFMAAVVSLSLVFASPEIASYKIMLEVETASDWTRVELIGGYIAASKYSVVEGEDAPGLRVHIEPSYISIGKKQFDDTLVRLRIYGFLIVTGDNVRVRITKGDIGYTSVRIYRPGGDAPIWNFTNEGVVPGSGGRNPREAVIGSEVIGSLEPYELAAKSGRWPKLVLAFYYPWYGNPQGPSSRWFHWKGVGYEEIGSATDYPLLGPYDSWDRRVLRSHIAMAKAAGIDGFISSWWGIGTFEDQAFQRLLDVAEEEGFKVTIYYESVRDISKEQVVEELSYVLSKYSNHSAFLKIGGKPVLFIYAVEAKGRDVEFWVDVIRQVENRTGVKALYIGDTYNTGFLAAFDGLHRYNPIGIANHRIEYLIMSERVKSYSQPGAEEEKIWCASVVPGYDDRKIRSPGQYVPRDGGEYYERTWTAAVESNPDIVTICSWNEWHEGTEIEPSREYGFKHLKLTRLFAQKFKGTTPREPEPPHIALTLGEDEDGAVIKVVNKGSGPAVIVHLLLECPSCIASTTAGYVLRVNDTHTIIFLPYLGPGEEAIIRAASSARTSLRSVKVVAWNPLGEKFQYSLENLDVELPVKDRNRGKNLTPLLAIFGVFTALAFAAFLKLWRSKKNQHYPKS